MLIGTWYVCNIVGAAHGYIIHKDISRVFSRGRREGRTSTGLIPRDKHFNYNLATYLRAVISSHSLNMAAVVRRTALFHYFCAVELHSGNCRDFLHRSHLPKVSFYI